MLKYYAQLDVQNVCVGVSQLAGVVDSDNLVELDSYDISVLGKLWQGGKWVDNPNKPPEPERPQPKPVTNEDIVAQLETLQAELEKAKKEQEATKSLMLDSMQGTADLYLVEQENKQLQLDAMQGIADLYAMQMGGGQ